MSDRIQDLLVNPEDIQEKRCRMWKKSLRAFSKKKPFDYNKLAWREEALEPDKIVDVEWNDFSQKHFGRLKFTYHKGFYESNWVRFHRGHLNNGTLSWRICFNLFL